MADRYSIDDPTPRAQFLTDSVLRGLARWNRERLAPCFPEDDWHAQLERGMKMLRLERAFLERLRTGRTAPECSAMVARGLRRIGLSDRACRCFDLHAVLDIKHSAAWIRGALLPLVAEDPRRAKAIAEGALVRCAVARAALPVIERRYGPSTAETDERAGTSVAIGG